MSLAAAGPLRPPPGDEPAPRWHIRPRGGGSRCRRRLKTAGVAGCSCRSLAGATIPPARQQALHQLGIGRFRDVVVEPRLPSAGDVLGRPVAGDRHRAGWRVSSLLYLRETRVTDAGLAELTPLKGLVRNSG